MATDSDLQTLLGLNRDYIQSVQTSDVHRFEELLAEDFQCSNPDGSLVDREAFLNQTARPVTISKLQAEDLDVRLLECGRTYPSLCLKTASQSTRHDVSCES
jgi:hypothetical protein